MINRLFGKLDLTLVKKEMERKGLQEGLHAEPLWMEADQCGGHRSVSSTSGTEETISNVGRRGRDQGRGKTGVIHGSDPLGVSLHGQELTNNTPGNVRTPW